MTQGAKAETGIEAARGKIYEFLTQSPEETMILGEKLGGLVQSGQLLALVGDLGAGKTQFVKGLAQGLGAPDPVTSPTFNLIHEYRGGRLPLFHFDVYRLENPTELENLGYEEYFFGKGVTAVEWSDQVKAYLGEEYLRITLRSPSEQQRLIQVEPVEPLGVHALSHLAAALWASREPGAGSKAEGGTQC